MDNFGNVVDIEKLIVFSNSFIAILIIAFFIAKSILIALKMLNEVSD
ncbi:hypothetical protein ACQJKE_000748 [Campylobacter jejuni]|nr:hypothetical protein [Campylobacter jejuni]EJA9520477.1 hypothetical protein [Campylobacter coli]AIW10533.1 hypothetical protein CJH_06830 [Campylobacter jejuni subsp. jejuni F38011]EFU2378181.1 hypothetical protein [Campylobacter jejuni]EHJ7654758.1 hypothetical protein [Campylobacter jejuni]EHJ7777848.1 hypothetical protein [Campylobacter jejuni]